MEFSRFSEENRRRCVSDEGFGHFLDDWSLSDWYTAVSGELGEAGNIIKKLNRIRDDISGNRSEEDRENLTEALKDEIADTFIYLDLIAQHIGFDLGERVAEVFDRKSAQIGYPVRISQGRQS